MQYKYGEGPCLEAITTNGVELVADLRTKNRRPLFARAAVEQTPARSMLSFRLRVTEKNRAGLNLYAVRPGAFTDESTATGSIFAAYASMALLAAARHDTANQLTCALDTNREIGVAMGILMANGHSPTSRRSTGCAQPVRTSTANFATSPPTSLTPERYRRSLKLFRNEPRSASDRPPHGSTEVCRPSRGRGCGSIRRCQLRLNLDPLVRTRPEHPGQHSPGIDSRTACTVISIGARRPLPRRDVTGGREAGMCRGGIEGRRPPDGAASPEMPMPQTCARSISHVRALAAAEQRPNAVGACLRFHRLSPHQARVFRLGGFSAGGSPLRRQASDGFTPNEEQQR